MSADIPTKKVTVQYDPAVVGLDWMTEVLAAEDYPVESVEEQSIAGATIDGRPVPRAGARRRRPVPCETHGALSPSGYP